MAFFEQFNLVNTSANNNIFESGSTYVQDVTQQDGQSQIEILAQILTELKILNQQIYELPGIMATGKWPGEPPENMRKDQTIFTI